MKFITNKISTGKVKSFADLVKEAESKNSKVVKVASSEEKEVKAETVEQKDTVVAETEGELENSDNEITAESEEDNVKEAEKDCGCAMKEEEEKEETKEEKEATSSSKMTKIANLTKSQKEWLKSYWSMIYPKEYADAMVQDK